VLAVRVSCGKYNSTLGKQDAQGLVWAGRMIYEALPSDQGVPIRKAVSLQLASVRVIQARHMTRNAKTVMWPRRKSYATQPE
jgi:hypothetical protein